ncbi:hypothetical protein Tco_0930903 [Tanacetum coccineum]
MELLMTEGKILKGQRSLFGRTTKGRKAGIGSPPTVDLVIPRLPRNKWSRDKNKYCHFHKDHEYDTNQYRELKHQIEEAVKYGQLVHLVKRVKKKEKLKPSIRSLRVDLKIPLVGFSGEKSWPLGEVPLEIMIGEGPFTTTKTLNFVIVGSDSPHNIILGRITMQQIGIVVSIIHGAIKFYTPQGIGIVLSQYNPRELEEEQRAISEEHQEEVKDVLSCIDAEERIVVNDQYPE